MKPSNVWVERPSSAKPRRYEVTHVPAPVRNRDRIIGIGEPVLPRYERIAFEKSLVAPQGQPLAAFVCPGHPLLDSVIDLTLERHRDLLRRGAVLVDESDAGDQPRVLFYLEHAIQDAGVTRSGDRRVVSKRMLYVEIDADGKARHLQYAPYLDYRPLAARRPVDRCRSCHDRNANGSPAIWSRRRKRHAVSNVVPEHLAEVRNLGNLTLIAKTEAAVKERLTKGDQLLGSPCRGAEAAGAGRQAECPAQFGRGAQACRHLRRG